jgi:hypothetical protein
MSYECISNPEQTKCRTGRACDYCNLIIHMEQISSTLDQIYTLLILQSKPIQSSLED